MAKEKVKEKSKEVKKKTNKEESGLKGIKKEMKLLKWPEKKEVLKYTISTVIFCVIVAIFFVILTYLLSILKGV